MLDDPDARAATFALFRAHGRELGDTPALGALAAAPYFATDDGTRTVMAFSRPATGGGFAHTLLGTPVTERILVDTGAAAPVLVEAAEVTLTPVAVPGRLTIHAVTVAEGAGIPVTPADGLEAARARSAFLARVAAAYEILGAAEGAFALAIDHANGRVQFGQPIGTFQAVRHLLAWAVTDTRAVESVTDVARDLDVAAPPRFDEIVKALAGRNGRRACERSLQVLGAIGFTAELDHHHFHSRVLALDAVAGTSAELATALGAWVRAERPDPRIAPAVLSA
ncbi:MAG: acyl-CoA dehydrogenase [Actinobacteria bacterium]|nr:acyl-CoA dehydrogenase [Actinomycetota bacterium]